MADRPVTAPRRTSTRARVGARRACGALAAALLMVGCGGVDAEELEAAEERVAELNEQVDAVEEEIAQRQQEVAEARGARDALADADDAEGAEDPSGADDATERTIELPTESDLDAIDPDEADGDPAPAMETKLEGLVMPEGSERVRVITDDDERSQAEYRIADAELADVAGFHLSRLTDGGWQEDEARRSTAELDGELAAQLYFEREPWEPSEGVESMRFAVVVQLVGDGANVRMNWSITDHQAAREATQ